jgi:hypothetical protein
MIGKFFLKRPIEIEEDTRVHKKYFHRALIATTVYAIIYGIYEYYIVYHTIALVPNKIITPGINWLIMCSGVLILIALLTHFRFKHMIFGLLFMLTLEDFTFWMCEWIDLATYPFPAGTWWDGHFATFRAIGGISWPLPFWPYLPFFYLPITIIIVLFYISCAIGPKTSQIYSWIVGPLWSAILLSLIIEEGNKFFEIILFSEAIALMIMLLFAVFSYIYLGILLLINKINKENIRVGI